MSLSTAQLVGVLLIALLTWTNTRGLEYGKIVQNVFTTAKTGALVALIVVGLAARLERRRRRAPTSATSGRRVGPVDIVPGLTAATAFGLFVGAVRRADRVALLGGRVEQHHVHRRRGEGPAAQRPAVAGARHAHRHRAVSARERRLPRDAAARRDPDTRRRIAWPRRRSNAVFPGARRDAHGGRHHDLDLRLQQRPDPGRRARLLRDGARRAVLPRAGRAERRAKVPAWGLVLQGIWAVVLVLPRTYNPATGTLRQSLRQPARLRDLRGADLLHPDDRRSLPSAAHAPDAAAALSRPSAIRSCRRSTSSAPPRFCSCSSPIGRRPPGPGWSSCCSALPVYFAVEQALEARACHESVVESGPQRTAGRSVVVSGFSRTCTRNQPKESRALAMTSRAAFASGQAARSAGATSRTSAASSPARSVPATALHT